MNKLAMTLSLVASTAAVMIWPARADDQKEIVIGAATSFSGWMAHFDVNATRAAELAVEDINAKGGVLGKKLRLVEIDTKTDQALTARAAQELVGKGVAMMMTACDFDVGAPAALVAQQANVLAISSCGADVKSGDMTIGNNVFTMASDSSSTGAIMADWATRKMGWKTAYVLLDTFIEYNKSTCKGFVSRFQELNGGSSIVLNDTFKNADVSVAAQISRYQALPIKPDVMMLCSVQPGHASALRQFRSAGINIPVLSGQGGDGSAWYSAVPGLSNYYHPNYSADAGVSEPRPDAEAFFKRYEAKYGERPESGQGITGYSVIEGWAKAVRRAGTTDPQAVRKELENFKDEPLVAGLTTFTPQLHINQRRPMLIIQTDNAKASPLGYYDIRKGDYTTWW